MDLFCGLNIVCKTRITTKTSFKFSHLNSLPSWLANRQRILSLCQSLFLSFLSLFLPFSLFLSLPLPLSLSLSRFLFLLHSLPSLSNPVSPSLPSYSSSPSLSFSFCLSVSPFLSLFLFVCSTLPFSLSLSFLSLSLSLSLSTSVSASCGVQAIPRGVITVKIYQTGEPRHWSPWPGEGINCWDPNHSLNPSSRAIYLSLSISLSLPPPVCLYPPSSSSLFLFLSLLLSGGRGSSAVERATPGEEVPGSIPAVAARSLQVGSMSV